MLLAVPQTYYNESGQAVGALARRHDLDADRVVVVHDELDLPPGRIKVKLGGGLAGNNGLRSIKAHLGTDDFVRVRIGVGKPPGRQEGADHVLRRPGKHERTELDIAIEEAADAVELIVAEGVDAAMTQVQRQGRVRRARSGALSDRLQAARASAPSPVEVGLAVGPRHAGAELRQEAHHRPRLRERSRRTPSPGSPTASARTGSATGCRCRPRT